MARRKREMLTRRSFLSKAAILTGSVAFGVANHRSDTDWLISESEFYKLGLNENCLTDGSGSTDFLSVRYGTVFRHYLYGELL